MSGPSARALRDRRAEHAAWWRSIADYCHERAAVLPANAADRDEWLMAARDAAALAQLVQRDVDAHREDDGHVGPSAVSETIAAAGVRVTDHHPTGSAGLDRDDQLARTAAFLDDADVARTEAADLIRRPRSATARELRATVTAARASLSTAAMTERDGAEDDGLERAAATVGALMAACRQIAGDPETAAAYASRFDDRPDDELADDGAL